MILTLSLLRSLFLPPSNLPLSAWVRCVFVIICEVKLSLCEVVVSEVNLSVTITYTDSGWLWYSFLFIELDGSTLSFHLGISELVVILLWLFFIALSLHISAVRNNCQWM